ncbi:hypothetical protein FISHEDRAFT_58766 [Fistulina hepatica ATCC 64428]|uniref:HMG box domain-containing protein n=1 Tax=Fistulina hepatica ATCC 64428 TaxID=1128425 RepID=A0A0D7ACU4_9AGAR|nr:hypothetical protein FISHEDRAFT_58766 [Fistulina hepatica ATCC 64428]
MPSVYASKSKKNHEPTCPPNAFFMYRSARMGELKAHDPDHPFLRDQRFLSKGAAKEWNAMTKSEKVPYEQLAHQRRLENPPKTRSRRKSKRSTPNDVKNEVTTTGFSYSPSTVREEPEKEYTSGSSPGVTTSTPRRALSACPSSGSRGSRTSSAAPTQHFFRDVHSLQTTLQRPGLSGGLNSLPPPTMLCSPEVRQKACLSLSYIPFMELTGAIVWFPERVLGIHG